MFATALIDATVAKHGDVLKVFKIFEGHHVDSVKVLPNDEGYEVHVVDKSDVKNADAGSIFRCKHLILASGTGISDIVENNFGLKIPIIGVRGYASCVSSAGFDLSIEEERVLPASRKESATPVGAPEKEEKNTKQMIQHFAKNRLSFKTSHPVPGFVFFSLESFRYWAQNGSSLDVEYGIPASCNFNREGARTGVHMYGKCWKHRDDDRTWLMLGHDRMSEDLLEKLKTARDKDASNNPSIDPSQFTVFDEARDVFLRDMLPWANKNFFHINPMIPGATNSNNLTTLNNVEYEGSWYGVMPFSLYGRPLVGKLDGDIIGAHLGATTMETRSSICGNSLWIAGGFGPSGIKLAPGAMACLSDELVKEAVGGESGTNDGTNIEETESKKNTLSSQYEIQSLTPTHPLLSKAILALSDPSAAVAWYIRDRIKGAAKSFKVAGTSDLIRKGS